MVPKPGNTYTKLLGDETDGYKIYGSLSTYLEGFGITYEYKDYNEPYFIQSLGGAPIVYRESTSILGSRYNHSMKFGDEIGHQLEIQYSINDNLNWMFNASQSNSHIGQYMVVSSDSLEIETETLTNYNHSNSFNLVSRKNGSPLFNSTFPSSNVFILIFGPCKSPIIPISRPHC